jgi:hypothetical protein
MSNNNKDEKIIHSGALSYLTDDPTRDKGTGLVIDTGVYDEEQEEKRRKHAAGMAHYAEKDDAVHFDTAGKYLCGGEKGDGTGGCNQYRPGSHACLSVKGRIDGDCGSCAWWENVDTNHSDLQLGSEKFDKEEALYGEREPGGTGWSCARCEYGSSAKAIDSAGRSLFCGIWGARVQEKACCGRNHRLGDTVFSDNRPLTQIEFYGKL